MTPLTPEDFFTGSGGGGASQSPTSKPDDLLSQDYVEIILGLTHGPIKGLVTPDVAGAGPLANYFFGETAVENLATHLPNFADFTITQYPGHDDDPPVARVLGGDASNLNVSVHCLQNIPVVRTTPSSLRKTADFAGLDRLEVRILFNSLVKSDDNGEGDETSHLRISYKPSNSTTWTDYNGQADTSVEGKTRGGYVKDFLIPVMPLTDSDYDVRVIKLSPDNGTKEIVDFNWESMQMVVLGRPEYPGLAKMHIYGKASSQFSSLPEMSGIFEGMLVQVPINYNPVTRVYDESGGPWLGGMKTAYTNNNAWILYYLINNPSYGMARYYKNIASNRGDFYNAGKWCDEQVSSGVAGVTQPRFTFNEYLDTQRQGLELLYYVAGSFNSTIYDSGNGVIRLKTDQLTTPKMIFTPENVGKAGFSYTFTDLATRYNDITVQFANPDFDWNTDERSASIDATDWIAENGRIPFSFTAVGCTDVHEAIRRANDRLLTANTEVTSVSMETTRFGMLAELNDVIYVADPVSGWSTGGRIKSYAGGVIQLRDPIFFEALTLVNITIQTYSGLVQLGVTPSQLGNCYSLNLVSGTWPTNIPDRTVFTVENADNLGMCKPFRVTGITEVEGKADQYQITAIEINPTKYEDSAAGTVSDAVTYDFTTPGEPIMPPELLLENVVPLVNSDGTLTYRVLASWVRPFQAYTDHYELEHQLAGTSEWVLDKVFGNSTEVKPVSDGKSYNWRLFAVTPVGNRCRNPILVNNFLVTPKNSILEDVRNLSLTQTNKGWQAKWDLPLNTPDLAGTRIKFSNPAAPWESLPDLYLSPSQEQDLPWFTAGTVRVQAKYINTSKNESADAIFIDQLILAPLNPTLTVETSFGLAQVFLTDPSGTQPLASLQLRQGEDLSTWETATLKQWSVAGGTRMFTVNPDATNPTKIFVRGVDVAGNLGSIAAVEIPAGANSVSELLDAVKGDIDETWITPGLLDHINFGDDSVSGSLATRINTLESSGGGQFEPLITFDFTNGSPVDNASIQGQNANYSSTGVTLISTGGDPIIFFSLTADQVFTGATYPILRVKLKRQAGSGWEGGVFYSTENHLGFNPAFYKAIPDPTIAQTDWVIAEWDMSTVTDWVSSTGVSSIRFDFGTTPDDAFQVQYIAVGRDGVGVSHALVQTEASTRADETGHLGAQWVTRVALTGPSGVPVIGGIALAGTSDANSTPSFDFTIRTNKFAIMPPAGLGADTPSAYFAYYTTPTIINNITVQPGIYVKSAFIESVTADKIDTRGLTVKDNSGNVLFGVNTPLAYQYITASTDWLNSNQQWNQVVGAPQQSGNLVLTPTFDRFPAGTIAPTWGWPSVAVSGVAWVNALYTVARDTIENNPITCRPGETFFIEGDLASRNQYNCCFGFVEYNSAGNVVSFTPGIVVAAGAGFAHQKNTITVTPTTVKVQPWLQIANNDGGTPNGPLYASNLYIGRAEQGATLGATFGQNISGQITAANASTYIASAAIGYAMIQYILASQIQTTSLSAISATIGTLRTAASGGRMELRDNVLKVYDETNTLRVKLGNLSL